MCQGYSAEKPSFPELPFEVANFWGNQKMLDAVLVILS